MISMIELSNSIVNTTVNIVCQPAPPPIFAIAYCSMLTCRGSWVWSHVVPVDTVQWETFKGENLQILRFCESFLSKNYFPPTCKSVLLYGKWYPGALKKQYFAIAPSSESLDWSYNKTNQLEYMTPEFTLSSLTLIQPLLATCTCNSTFRVPCTRLYLKRSNKLWCCTSGLTSYVNVTYSTYHLRLNRHICTLQVITKTQDEDLGGSVTFTTTYRRYPAIVTGS